MMRKLITGVFVTAVALLPLTARADWNELKQRGDNLEQRGKTLENEGKTDYNTGQKDYAKGKVVEQKSVTTYKKGRNYAKTTYHKVRKE